MTSYDKERLDFLFELENIKMPLMNYIAPGVTLKAVADLGNKDQNGNKMRFYEETLYPSKKYMNTDVLVSSVFRVNTYLMIEYPNPAYNTMGGMKKNALYIRAYAIEDVIAKIREFNNGFMNAYGVKNGKIHLISDKVKEITVYPSFSTSLAFKNDIYENRTTGNLEMGVQITINNEFSCIVSAENVWPEFTYHICNCNLDLLGLGMIQSYLSMLPGMAVSDMRKNSYNSTSRYTPFWGEDPDEIMNRSESVKVTRNKPLTDEEKKKSFFSDL